MQQLLLFVFITYNAYTIYIVLKYLRSGQLKPSAYAVLLGTIIIHMFIAVLMFNSTDSQKVELNIYMPYAIDMVCFFYSFFKMNRYVKFLKKVKKEQTANKDIDEALSKALNLQKSDEQMAIVAWLVSFVATLFALLIQFI